MLKEFVCSSVSYNSCNYTFITLFQDIFPSDDFRNSYPCTTIVNALFNRFNKESTPELQAWYYKRIMKALAPLKTWKMYTELCEVVKELYEE